MLRGNTDPYRKGPGRGEDLHRARLFSKKLSKEFKKRGKRLSIHIPEPNCHPL